MHSYAPFEHIIDERLPGGLGGRWYGVFPALVVDIKDPDGQGRVKIQLPWSPDTRDQQYETWARLVTLQGGNNRGSWFIPDVNDEVLVTFEAGNPRRPYVLGGLWNGRDAPPATMDGAGKNNEKVLRSRNGVKVTLDDSDGRERLLLETPGGQKLTLQDGPGTITIADSNGNSIKLESSGMTLTTSAKMSLNASMLEITAPVVNIKAGTSTVSGMTLTDTLKSNTVISATYTPGAGNMW